MYPVFPDALISSLGYTGPGIKEILPVNFFPFCPHQHTHGFQSAPDHLFRFVLQIRKNKVRQSMPVIQRPSLFPDSQNSRHRDRLLQMLLIKCQDIQLAVLFKYVGRQIPYAAVGIQQQILHTRPGAFQNMIFILHSLSPDKRAAVQQITVSHFHGARVICKQPCPYDGLAVAVFFLVEK